MRLETIQLLRISIVLILTYVPIVTIAGFFESWFASVLGDDVPKKSGFLTLNPLVHFSFFGFMLMFFGFPPFGQVVPITPEVFMGRTKNIRVVLDYFGRAIAHFLMLLVSFLIIVLVLHGSVTGAVKFIPTTSSFIEVIRLLLSFFFAQNFFLFCIHFVWGIIRSAMFFWLPDMHMISFKSAIGTTIIMLIVLMVGFVLLEKGMQSALLYIESLLLS